MSSRSDRIWQLAQAGGDLPTRLYRLLREVWSEERHAALAPVEYLREKDEAVRDACLEIIEMCRPGWKDRYTARAAQMRMQFATASGDGGDGSEDE